MDTNKLEKIFDEICNKFNIFILKNYKKVDNENELFRDYNFYFENVLKKIKETENLFKENNKNYDLIQRNISDIKEKTKFLMHLDIYIEEYKRR